MREAPLDPQRLVLNKVARTARAIENRVPYGTFVPARSAVTSGGESDTPKEN